MSRSFGVKRKGAILTLALSILGSLTLVGGTASAATELGNIDANETGSIIVHKYEAPEWDQKQKPANGTELQVDAGKKTIDGVTFTIQKIKGIDLTKQADWERLKALSPATAEVEGNVTEQETANGGKATFAGLKVGAYVLKEKTPPANLSITKKAADTIVTIPFPTDETTVNSAHAKKGWLYEVHVYPKNEVANKLTKIVADDTPTTVVGSEIKWQLTVPVPNPAKPFTKFEVSDDLEDSLKLNDGKTTVMLDNTDITAKVEVKNTGVNGGKIVFDFANALDDLTKAKGKNVVITFNTEIVSIPSAGDGKNIIPNNTFSLTYKNEGDTEDKVVPPPTDENDKPKAYFGDYTIKKISSLGKKLPLRDAEFKLYKTKVDAADPSNAIATATSDENGIVKFTGVYRGKLVGDTKEYFVKESKAPAGYKLSEEVTPVEISATSGAVTGDKEIENIPYQPGDVPALPMTGSAGKVLLILAGVAILAISFGTAFVTRRNKANN